MKIISKMLVIALASFLFSITTVHAFADSTVSIEPVYSGEIRFQGLEWGCNPSVFEEKLIEMGIDIGTSQVTRKHKSFQRDFDGYTTKWNWTAMPGIDYECNVSNFPQYKLRFIAPNMELVNIAGHNVYQIISLYLPSYDLNRSFISTEFDEMRLRRVEYYFYNKSRYLEEYDVFMDLLTKLTEVYGNPTPVEEKMRYKKYESYIWYGKNKTAVQLVFSETDSVFSTKSVQIIYAFAGDDEDVRNIRSILNSQKEKDEKQKKKNGQSELETIQDDYSGL